MEFGEDDKPCSCSTKYRGFQGTDFPRWCQFCKHFGSMYVWHACYHSWLARLGWKNPKLVNFDDCCRHFKYAKIYADQQKTK